MSAVDGGAKRGKDRDAPLAKLWRRLIAKRRPSTTMGGLPK